MTATNAMIERAEAAVDAERDRSLHGIRLTVARPGRPTCIDCDRPIAPERLKAAPFACRCIVCQDRFEHHARGM